MSKVSFEIYFRKTLLRIASFVFLRERFWLSKLDLRSCLSFLLPSYTSASELRGIPHRLVGLILLNTLI